MQRLRRPAGKAKAVRSGRRASGQEKTGSNFVGLDAHKEWISVAMRLPGRETPIEWRIPNEAGAIRRTLRRIEQESPGEIRFCYEAGPCGYALQRQVTAWSEASCMVVAPSLIPSKPGERIKTDRRDAKKLASLFRAGLLTEVQPPSEEDEAARDLCRAREDAREDLVRCRHRLTKFLLRRGMVFTVGKRAWTGAHRQWLRGLRLEQPWDRVEQSYQLRSSIACAGFVCFIPLFGGTAIQGVASRA